MPNQIGRQAADTGFVLEAECGDQIVTHRSLGVMLSASPVIRSGFLTAENGSMDGWKSWSDQDSALKVSPLFYTLTVLTDYGLSLRHVCVYVLLL